MLERRLCRSCRTIMSLVLSTRLLAGGYYSTPITDAYLVVPRHLDQPESCGHVTPGVHRAELGILQTGYRTAPFGPARPVHIYAQNACRVEVPYPSMSDLQGKRIVVTGAASGFGAEISRRAVARSGAPLAIFTRVWADAHGSESVHDGSGPGQRKGATGGAGLVGREVLIYEGGRDQRRGCTSNYSSAPWTRTRS